MSISLQNHFDQLYRSTQWRRRYILNLVEATKSKQWLLRTDEARQRILSALENNTNQLVKESPATQFTPLVKQARYAIELYRIS